MSEIQEIVTELAPLWGRTLGDTVGSWEVVNDDVLRIKASSGERYILKGIEKPPSPEHLAARLDLLLHLSDRGVPVAPPIPTDTDADFVEYGDRLYLLSAELPAGGRRVPDTVALANRGAAIGRLHRALADYPGQVPSWTVDWPRAVLEEYIPKIRAHQSGSALSAFDTAVQGFAGEMRDALTDLPAQRLHGDCHEGNLLLFDGEVSGVIDLDHLPVGPRLYDLSWLVTNRTKFLMEKPGELAPWRDALPHLYAGYNRENPLSPREQAALWNGIAAFHLLFWAWMLPLKEEAQIDSITKAFYWSVQNRSGIEARLSRV